MTLLQSDKDFILEQPEHLRPVLRLFLSVDLVNSTAFKQKSVISSRTEKVAPKRYSPWLEIIAGFYREFPVVLEQEWSTISAALKQNVTHCSLKPPRLWKANGDELIYVLELQNSCQPSIVLCAWIRAIDSYRIKLLNSGTGLDLKSVCWIAGFPVANTEILFQETAKIDALPPNDSFVHQADLKKKFYIDNDRNGILRDYIGPSIDTGFRLGSLATPRKLVVSLDLIWLVSSCTLPKEIRAFRPLGRDFEIFYEGRKDLKGVLAGVQYPMFWIDVDSVNHQSLNAKEDKLSNRVTVVDKDIREFCDHFTNDQNVGLLRPFILGDTLDFSEPDDKDYIGQYRRFIAQMTQNTESEQALAELEENAETVVVSDKAEATVIKQKDLRAFIRKVIEDRTKD